MSTTKYIARLNSDGTLDTSFTAAGAGLNNYPETLAIQADGKVLLGGPFYTVNGASRLYLGRLNTDGTLDTGFNPSLNNGVTSVTVQPDGKIVIGGVFTSVNGTAGINRIARLNADGTLDTSFNSGGSGANANLLAVVVQGDGKLLLGGFFTSVNGTVANRIARLNADGTLDSAFTSSGAGTNNGIHSVAVQTDGKVVFGGIFTSVNGMAGINNFARLNADGTIDPNFNAAGAGANYIFGVAIQADGKVVICGDSTDRSRCFLARVNNDAATQSLTAPDSTQVQWQRSGASPEISQVTFELSTDGGTVWTPLGVGARISGGWQLTNLSLPVSGLLRARARTIGGYTSSSSGLVQTVVAFPSNSSAPVVTTGGIVGRTETAAFLLGTVNPGSRETTAYFEYGATTSYGSTAPVGSVGSGPSNVSVQAPLTGLSVGTLYHYRVVGMNDLGTTLGADATFTTAGPAAVVTGGANSVTKTGATLNGTVTPDGIATSAYFEYGPTTAYGTATATQTLGSGMALVNVQATISGLAPNTTYHFRLVSTSAAGTVFGTDVTLATDFDPPTVATLAPTTITMTGATLNARVNPSAAQTTVSFQYGGTTDYGSVSSEVVLPAGSADVDVPIAITGLQAGVTYHCRAVATNGKGTRFGSDASFTTAGSGGDNPTAAPTVATGNAAAVGTRMATLQGVANPNGGATVAQFEYGLTTSYGLTATPQPIGGGGTPVNVSQGISGLTPGATYHFRIGATNSLGTNYGPDNAFTTPFEPPSAMTDGADEGTTFVTLNATVNPNSVATSVSFIYGTSPTLAGATTVPVQGSLAGAIAQAVSLKVMGLVPQTIYFYQVTAASSAGTTPGTIESFTTLGAQAPRAVPDHLYVGVQTASLDVLANDVNADTEQTGAAAGLLWDGVVTAPTLGEVSGGPVISFDPFATRGSFPLSGDQFTYRVKSPAGLTNIGTVFVHSFAAYRGSYGGVIVGGTGTNGGSLTLELSLSGSFTGQLIWQSKSYGFRSQLGSAGTVTFSKPKNGAAAGVDLTVSLALQPNGLILGELLDEESGKTFLFTLRSANDGGGTDAQPGIYTAHIDQSLGAAEPEAAIGERGSISPQAVTGFGYTLARLSRSRNGARRGKFIGRVPDTEAFSSGSKIFAERALINARLYRSGSGRRTRFGGSLTGESAFAGGQTLTSVLEWIKAAGGLQAPREEDSTLSRATTRTSSALPTLFPDGFHNGLVLAGDRYLQAGESPALTFVSQFGTKAEVRFSAGGLAGEQSAQVQFTLRGGTIAARVLDTSFLKTFKVVASQGVFSGTFAHPNPLFTKPVRFAGAFRRYSGDEKGKGSFRGATNAGFVTVFKIE